jgi:uracil-DNA glycosylase
MPRISIEEQRFRDIFRSAHAEHLQCERDEWLNTACLGTDTAPLDRPLIWSRRNGPWHRVDVLWTGSAPGNAGGMGGGPLGAHGTRIPFGGDISGGNLEVLMAAAGATRNDSFIVASLNRLPRKGGGEPSVAEIAEPVGEYADSVALLRDTLVAAGPRLIIALGNTGMRVVAAAVTRPWDAVVGSPADAEAPPPVRLPSTAALARAGIRRGTVMAWPEPELRPADGFMRAWHRAWGESPLPCVVQVLHPSAQNMSPFAGAETVFHTRMIETRDAVREAALRVCQTHAAQPRPPVPDSGIYALAEWRELVAPVHARYDELWRSKGV